MDNKHSVEIPPAVIEEAKRMIGEVITLIEPYLITLTAEERRHLPKMGDKTLTQLAQYYSV